MATAQLPKRGEIWLVDFDPAVGAEIRKLRPAVVISLDSIGRLPLRVVVPVTDWKSQYANFPWMIRLPAARETGLAKESVADTFQVKSVSLRRLVHKIGNVAGTAVDEIAEAIALCVGAP
jgi:mRNA interferase MazF